MMIVAQPRLKRVWAQGTSAYAIRPSSISCDGCGTRVILVLGYYSLKLSRDVRLEGKRPILLLRSASVVHYHWELLHVEEISF